MRDGHGSRIYPGDTIKIPTKTPVAAGGGAPAATPNFQSELIHKLDQRLAKLAAERANLVKDLAQPARHAEAEARIAQVDAQTAMLQGIKGQAVAFHPNDKLGSETLGRINDLFKTMSMHVEDLSDPKKSADTQITFNNLFNDAIRLNAGK